MDHQADCLTTRNKRSTQNLAIWTFSWVVTLALATFGHIHLWSDNLSLTLIAFGLNLAAGIGMILSNIRYIKALDELQRKMQLEAMGMSLGVGVVGGLSYSLMDTTNIISTDAEIGMLVVLISLTYLATLVISHFRYQ